MIDQPRSRVAATLSSPEQRARLDSMELFLAHWRATFVVLVLVTLTAIVAWRDYVPPHITVAWCVAISFDYLCQGAICHRMQRAASTAEAMTRWMPALMVSIAASGVLWALVPWLLSGAPTKVLLFACLFNGLMTYCIANSPGTRGMFLSAAIPVALLDTIVLVRQEGVGFAVVGFMMMMAMVLVYGLRHRAVLHTGMAARHTAEDLAHELAANQPKNRSCLYVRCINS